MTAPDDRQVDEPEPGGFLSALLVGLAGFAAFASCSLDRTVDSVTDVGRPIAYAVLVVVVVVALIEFVRRRRGP